MNNIAEYVSINDYTRNAMENILINPKDIFEIKSSEFCSYEKDKVWWNEE